MTTDKTSAEFFEQRYAQDGDPWNFAKSDYEQGRFETILAALAHRRYRRAFEPGCSIGTLTIKLAGLAEQVDASDFSGTAVEHAKRRCAHLTNVHITRAALNDAVRLDGYDLVILSEIGYYFRPEEWSRLLATLVDSMDQGTIVLGSHWLGQSEDHLQAGDEVHHRLRKEPRLQVEYSARHPGFRLDRFVRV